MASGEILRETRVSLGLTLEAAEEETKIRRKYLEALEREDYEQLPGRVYAKAFLRTYAKFLGLDSEVLIREFDERYPLNESEIEVESKAPTVSGSRKRPAYLGVLLVAGVIAGLFAFNSFYGGGTPGGLDQVQRPPVVGENPSDPGEPTGEDPVIEEPVPNNNEPDGVEVVLVVTESPSWIRVMVDGVEQFQGTVPPGETLDFTGRESISFRVGNAGAVEVHLNGENLGLAGEYGDVVDREFTVDG